LIKTFTAIFLALLILNNPVSSAEETLDLAQFEGKVVVLDFWASWCVPCRRSFPWWNTMQAKYGDAGLVVIGVNLDNDLQEAATFLGEYAADFKIHYDKDKVLAKQFGVQAMPSTYILGRDGELFARHFGFKVKQQGEYEAALVDALQAGE
jgi:cytochrome c biogenesis protein CcmG/thiol:disulfide interchange protein DsbE